VEEGHFAWYDERWNRVVGLFEELFEREFVGALGLRVRVLIVDALFLL
jgi:hypothetical protein